MENALPRGFWLYAGEAPDDVAVVDPDGRVTTRGELLDRVERISNYLVARGLGIDDRFAVLVRNSVHYFEWMLAGAQLGLHAVPINYHLTPGEIGYILANSSSSLLVVDVALVDMARDALAAIPADPGASDGFAIECVTYGDRDGFHSMDEVLAAGVAPLAARISGMPMLYTAGTTGRPKGVLWPARPGVTPEMAVAGGAPMFARRGMSVGGVTLVCGPLYHGAPGGQGLQALHWGQSVVLMDRWDSEQALALIERYRVTHAQMAPIHFHRLLQLAPEVRAQFDVSSLRAVTHAGSGCPVEVKHAMITWFGPVLYEYYAASEGFGTSITPAAWLAHPGSVGHQSSDGAEVLIMDESGDEVPAGEVGTVFLRLPGVGESEYLGDPEKTAASRGRDGFRTFGDMGYLDAEGWLYLVDRRADLILSGAVNIYPAEVEAGVRSHPAVDDVAVIGIPDAEWGQLVVAVVVLAGGFEPSDELVAQLSTHCEANLAKFKCPRRWEFRSELPYSGAGKLLRRELRDPYWL